jgi:hypothetical protein
VTAAVVGSLPWPDVEAVLVRPDGYLCWAAPGGAVAEPLRTWFGEAAQVGSGAADRP